MNFPIIRHPYRLWNQVDHIGLYSINPGETSLSIWHVNDGCDQDGFWAMVATRGGGQRWTPLNVEPLPAFEMARDLILTALITD